MSVVRLEASRAQLRVARAIHRALVDVGGADERVLHTLTSQFKLLKSCALLKRLLCCVIACQARESSRCFKRTRMLVCMCSQRLVCLSQ